MDDVRVILEADRGQRVRAAIPAVIFIVILALVALWLSLALGPVGVIGVLILIAAGVVWFFLRTTTVALSVSNNGVVVRNTLRTTLVPLDEVDGMALSPDGELQVLRRKKHGVVVEAADGRHEEDLAVAAEATMQEVDRRSTYAT